MWLLVRPVKFMWLFCKLGHRVDPTRGPRRKSGTLGGDEQSAMMPCSRRGFLRIARQIYSLDYMSALAARLCAIPTIKPWVATKSLCPLGSSMEIQKTNDHFATYQTGGLLFQRPFPEQVPEPHVLFIISFHHSFLFKVWQLIHSEWTNIDVTLFFACWSICLAVAINFLSSRPYIHSETVNCCVITRGESWRGAH